MANPIRLSDGNMRIRPDRFNIIFLLVTAAMLASLAGCQSPESQKKKLLSTLRVHAQMVSESANASATVPVFRENPVLVSIESSPLLTEADVTSAAVVDVVGGFGLQVRFNRHGAWLLEQYSVANKGRRLVIFSQFGDTANEARWLAAPRITQRIPDGTLVFTPDATREEAERIVLGLTNAARKLQKNVW